MVISRRKLLIATYLIFQTLSILTETLQQGVINAAVNAANIAYLGLFVVWQPASPSRHIARIKLAARLLVVLLAMPALLTFTLSGETSQIVGAARIWLWTESLLFAAAWCDDRPKRDFVFRVLQGCGVLVLVAVLSFNVFRFGETAYELGHLYLGSTLSLPTLALFALALLLSFLYPNDSRLRMAGYLGLFALILLLMKRSAVVGAILVFAAGWGSFFRRIKYQRSLFAAIFVVAGLLYAGELTERLQSNAVLMERFSDIRKLEATQDIRYLGSGRLRLAELWWQYFSDSSPLEMIFGQVIENPDQITGNRYLGMELPMPHNDVLDVLLRGGLLALLAYIALWTLVFSALFGRRLGAHSFRDHMAQKIGRVAFFLYLIHIPIGVVTKLQFMTVIALYIGIALRHSVEIKKQV